MNKVGAAVGAVGVSAVNEDESEQPSLRRLASAQATSEVVDFGEEGRRYARSVGGLVEVYRDAQVRVVTDAAMTQAQGRALASRVEEAYRFDSKKQHWPDNAPLAKTITIAALSREAFAQVTGDTTGSVAGVTTSPDVFALPASQATRRTADGDATIAHELGHIQDLREGGQGIDQVPIYLQEGKEYLLGDMFPASRGATGHSLQSQTWELGRISGAEALDVMRNFRTVRDEAEAGPLGFRGEVVGALFVEFLRTRLNGGTPDAIGKVADVIADVGQGASYAQAFKAQFKVTPAEAETAFVRYVAQTTGNPWERLRGTLYYG
jgi:hypothetical protein